MSNRVKRFTQLAGLLVLAGFALSMTPLNYGDQSVFAAQKKGKKTGKDKKDDKKKPPEKKKIPKDKTPPVLTIKGHKGWINSLSFSKDGKLLITSSRDKTVKVWNLKDGKEVTTLKEHPTNVHVALFAPDGEHAVSTTGKWDKKKKAWEGEIRFWDIKSGKVDRTIKGHSAEIECAVFSADGQKLITAGDDNTAIIWEVKSGKALQTLKGHKKKINGVAISKDGSKVATASADSTVKIWDASNGKELTTIKGPKRDVSSVAFSPDGKTIAGGSWDGHVYIWEMSGKELKKLEAQEGVLSIDFSGNGKYLAASGWEDTTKVWDVESGKELFYRNGHTKSVLGVAFSPDDSRLITIGMDETVKVWEMPKGK